MGRKKAYFEPSKILAFVVSALFLDQGLLLWAAVKDL